MTVEQRWRWQDGALHLGDRRTALDRLVGDLAAHRRPPAAARRVRGSRLDGTGPGENYADSRAAAPRIGRFAASLDDLTVRYAGRRCPRSGHREGLRELRLAGDGLPDLTVTTAPVAGRAPASWWRGTAQKSGPPPATSTNCRPPRRSPLPRPRPTRAGLAVMPTGRAPRAHALWPRPVSASCRCGWGCDRRRPACVHLQAEGVECALDLTAGRLPAVVH